MNLVLDFDGTITVKDTIGRLADAAIAFQQKFRGVDLKKQWDAIAKEYYDDLESFNHSYSPAEADRVTVVDELRYLSQLSVVESASIDRVDKAGLFSGLKPKDLFGMGVKKVAEGQVAVRPGLREMLQLARRQGWRTSVLSVNWSVSFIEGVLHGCGVECAALGIEVLANEAGEEGSIRGPEILGRRLTTAADKRECLEKMDERRQREQGSGTGKSETLYVGDSPTDLACLLRGRGVVITDDGASAVMGTLERLGIWVPHVRDGDGAEVVWARDFLEILESKMMGTTGPAPGQAE